MTILYDASILGYSLLRKEYRTGIFRVAVAQIRALYELPGVRLVVLPGAGNQLLVQLALRSLGLKHVLVAGSRFWGTQNFALLLARNFLYRKDRKTLASLAEGLRRTIMRRRVNADRRWLEQSHWYVSPMEAVPAEFRNVPTLGVAYILHDLIPLKMGAYEQDPKDPTRWFSHLMRELRIEDIIFAVSAFTRNDFLAMRPLWPQDRVFVAPNAIEADRFTPIKTGIIPQRYLLTISTVEPRKRIDTIISAFESYRRHGGQSRLVICGVNRAKHLTKVLETVSDEIRSEILFTGYLPDEALPELYRGCLAFLYLSEYEGFGLPVLEAMSCGAPVIVTSLTSLPEVAGSAGIYVGAGDAEAVCSAIRRLDTDEEWRLDRRAASLAQAGRFSWAKTAETICNSLDRTRSRLRSLSLGE